jgi:hypothetical protein
MGIAKEADQILSSKVKFKRFCIFVLSLIALLGAIAFFVLTDQSCDWKNKAFGTKSKVKIDIDRSIGGK